MAKKKFTAKQKAWRGALAIAIAAACLSIAPLLAIGDQPFAYKVTEEMAAENAGISTTGVDEETADSEETSYDESAPTVAAEASAVSVEVEEFTEETPEDSEQLLSVQAEENIASIDGVPYGSLQAAIDAAGNNAVITLNEDVTECVTVNATKNFTLDLAGHVIDGNKKGTIFNVTATSCSISIKNGEMKNGASSSSSYAHAVHVVNGNNALLLENLNVVGCNPDKTGYAIKVGSSSTSNACEVTLRNCTVSSARGGICIMTSKNVKLENCNITGVGAPSGMDSDYEPLLINGSGLTTQVDISGTNIYGNKLIKQADRSTIEIDKATATVSNCQIYNNTVKSGCAGIKKGASAKLTINNSVIKNNIASTKGAATSSKVYSGGVGALSSSSVVGDLVINGGAIYGNQRAGVLSDFVYVGSKAKYKDFDKSVLGETKVFAASEMSDPGAGLSNSYFVTYGYKWLVNDASLVNFSNGINATVSESDESIFFNGAKLAEFYTGNTGYTQTGVAEVTYYTAKTKEPTFVAAIGESKFMTLREAFEAANPGDTIQLYFKNDSDRESAIMVEEDEPIFVSQDVSLDFNGGTTTGNLVFEVSENGALAFENTYGDAVSKNENISVSNKGKTVLGSKADISSVANSENGQLHISGTHDKVDANISNGQMLDLAEDADCKSIVLTIKDSDLQKFNNGSLNADINLINCATEEQAKQLAENNIVTVNGNENESVKVVYAGDNILALRITGSKIYLGHGAKCDHEKDPEAIVVDNLDEAIAKATEQGLSDIVVCSPVVINDSNRDSLNIQNKCIEFKRCSENHDGAMLELNGVVSLKNVVINGCEVDSGSSPMIKAVNGSDVTIVSGVVIKNARRTGVSGTYSGGGALEMAYGQSANKLTVNEGSFENNSIKAGSKGNGGAVWAWHADIKIANGSFKENYARVYGGALFTEWDSSLQITGGSFVGNVAGSKGGALGLFAVYISSGEKGFHGTKTSITGGVFKENEAHESQYYAGGAIYNGRGCLLNVRNALITNNTKNYGEKTTDAAVANCSTGSMAIYKTQGALITNNGSGNADIALDGSTGKTLAMVSDYTLGGGDCNWGYAHNYQLEDGTWTNAIPEESKNYYRHTRSSFSIKSNPSQITIDEARERATVVFENNHATAQGTAIMNNGTLVIGANSKNLEVVKEWKNVEPGEEPTEVEVQLARYVVDASGQKALDENGNYIYELMDESFRSDVVQKLNLGNEWKAFWSDLPEDSEWVAVEKTINGYSAILSDPSFTVMGGKAESELSPEQVEAVPSLDSDQNAEGIILVSYVLTNTWNDDRTNVFVEKFWDDNDNQYNTRPETIELMLVVDTNKNNVVDPEELQAVSTQTKTVRPDEDKKWRVEFTDLPKFTTAGDEIRYLIIESSVDKYASGEPERVIAEDGSLVWMDDDKKEWSGFNITNSLDLSEKSIQVTKTWKDEDNTVLDHSDIPESVMVALTYKDGNEYKRYGQPVELNAENGWTVTWEHLDASLEWKIAEEGNLSGYKWTTSTQGTNYENGGLVEKVELVNTWQDEQTNISAEKIWDDRNNLYQTRPESVELTLMQAVDANRNGVRDDDELFTAAGSASVKANEEGVWRWEFTNLAKYTKKGQQIFYSIEETPVDGHISKVEQVDDERLSTMWFDGDGKEWSAFNVTNSLEYGSLTIKKKLDGAVQTMSGGDGNATVVFHVVGTMDGKTIYDNYAGITFNQAGESSVTLDGLLIGAEYTVTEEIPDGSGYTAVKVSDEPLVLTKDANGDATIEFSFENVLDEEDHPSHGIVNTYTYDTVRNAVRASVSGVTDIMQKVA